MDSLTFVIPTYNDETTVRTVVEKSIRVARQLHVPYDVIVANDASFDTTGAILTQMTHTVPHLRIITHAANAGYGATMKELYTSAAHAWLFSLPGDYQIEPEELKKLWLRRRGADMIIGRRIIRHDSPARRVQSNMYNRLIRALYGGRVHDHNSVRLMKTSIMKKVHLTTSSAFVDAELIIRSVRAGFRVIEIAIAHRARAGVGAGGGKLKTIIPTILDMIAFRLKSL